MTGSPVWSKDDEGMAVCIICVHKRHQHSKYALCPLQHLQFWPRLFLAQL
ncbi:hypothetical protein M405DRAFT_826248 [Rhizopogon salebrosus TDB-379]|nr:hypothetical protein M405DRAFT_826248 [Rhizopogon salebrosus TDB-379]